MRAYVLPVEGPLRTIELVKGESHLEVLQEAVGGHIEALPFRPDPGVTIYVNEEGKYECEPNMRATDVMIGTIFPGDYIAGPMVIAGFDAVTGEHVDLPEPPAKVRLVLREAAL
jgi:hypothetical protein